MNILLVEKSRSQQVYFRKLFESYGFDVQICTSGEQALNVIEYHSFDLVSSSISLDGMQGDEFCKKLRSNKRTSDIPIIMVTSGASKLVSRCLKAGATDVFNKKDVESLSQYISRYRKEYKSDFSNIGSKILFVEDSKSAAHIVMKYLIKQNMNVDHFETAEEAIEAIKLNSYDLVITDIILKGKMSGLRLVRQIREGLGDNELPILVTSGFSDNSRIVEVYRAGANDYANKPLIEEVLMARVNNLISQKISMEQLKKRNKELKKLSIIDELSGLYNRRILMDVGQEYIKDAIQSNLPLSLVIFDIDYFKKVNDTYGHTIGDVIIKSIAEVLSSQSREGDLVTRYGGEEFVLILKNCDLTSSINKCKNILNTIRVLNPKNIAITASAGLCMLDKQHKNLNEMFDHADAALYKAKNNGRNQIQVASIDK